MFTHEGMPDSTDIFSVEAARQVFNQTNEFVFLGGGVSPNADLPMGVERCIRNASTRFRMHTLKLYDRPSAPLELKLRMLRPEVLEIMLYGCVTWSSRKCHYDTLRRAHHSFLVHCIGWRMNNSTDHSFFYLDTLITTGSQSIEAIVRRREILFAGFVARMEDTRLPKSVMFVELVVGAGCVGGQKTEWMRRFLDDLGAFVVNADQWTTAAQDEGEWCKTVEQGAEHFMTKWTAAEKVGAGLWHAVIYSSVTEGPRRGQSRASMIMLARSP